MANRTISENINQAISDFKGIKQALIDKGIEIPQGTPTSEYGAKIDEFKGIVDTTDLKEVIERTTVNPKLPNDLTSIGGYAFYQCRNLALTELPSGVTSIGISAFYQCNSLALKKLPSGVTSIGAAAFAYCSKLKLTEIPASVTVINNQAFMRCDSMTEITFKGKPNTISSGAFTSSGLKTIRVPWASGEVANAPWGATNASILYSQQV